MVEWSKQTGVREIGDSDKPEVKGEIEYLVKMTDSNDDPALAISSTPGLWTVYVGSGTSKQGGYYFALTGLVVKERTCKVHDFTGDGGIIYKVTLTYGTDTRDPKDKDPNPINRPIKMSMSFDSFEETIFKVTPKQPNGYHPTIIDASGAKLNAQMGRWAWGTTICNSAGKPLDPALTVLYRDPILTIKKNFAQLPWDTQLQYVNTVNTDTFTITYRDNQYTVGVGQGWLYDLTSEPQYENGVQFEEVTVTLRLRNDGWLKTVLDAGMEGGVLEPPTPATPGEPFRDKNGDPYQQPTPLDGQGIALGSLAAASKIPVFLQWDLQKKQAFSGLPFWS